MIFVKTRDIDIRNKLHGELKSKYLNDDRTLIIDELSLCQGEARIDVAVINGVLHGYEIKSESDNLDRLPSQISVYDQVMDKITIITGENHLEEVRKLVPEWWGIKLVVHNKRSISLKSIKRAKRNKNVNSYSLVQLLWKEEALEILKKEGLDKGYRTKSRKEMWERLAIDLPLNDLRLYVIDKLKNRSDWRVD
jgi:hypothetical protein